MPGGSLMPSPPAVFGKLPAHGDFVRRGDPALARRLDAWLTAEVERLAGSLGEALDSRLEALPVWAFTLPDGLAGALAASHDRVGRVFPLAACAAGGRGAAEEAATLLVRARDEVLDADALAAALAGLAGPVDDPAPDTTPDGARWWRPLAEHPLAFAIPGLPAGPDFDRLFDVPDLEERA